MASKRLRRRRIRHVKKSAFTKWALEASPPGRHAALDDTSCDGTIFRCRYELANGKIVKIVGTDTAADHHYRF